MKNSCVFTYFKALFFGLVICVISFCFGCAGTPGETVCEVNRRHRRVFNHAHLQLQDDVDALFLIDAPSKLSDYMAR